MTFKKKMTANIKFFYKSSKNIFNTHKELINIMKCNHTFHKNIFVRRTINLKTLNKETKFTEM